MTDTANLALPCIEGSQAQKHVTHNEALRILDTLVQLAVLDRDLTAPPGAPTEGQCWIVKTGATGAWASHVDAIAAWQDSAWQFSTPRTGWLAYVIDESALVNWNGSAWVAAIKAGREVLTANRTYYVRTDGSDSNSGLTNTAGGAFLTIQKAINVVATLDLNGYDVTIQVESGTYTGLVTVAGPWVGRGTVTLRGNTSSPSSVLISTAGVAIAVSNYGNLSIAGLKIATSSGAGINALTGGVITVSGAMDFGAIGGGQMLATTDGKIVAIGVDYTISGSASYHLQALTHGSIVTGGSGRTVTLTGTPAFSGAFALADRLSYAQASGITYSGAATGVRYSAVRNGVIFTAGGGASYLPGNASGSVATGGDYS